MPNKGEILLHCCCGPCSTVCIKRLISEGWSVVLYYANSNIFPFEENEKRYGELVKVSSYFNLKVIRGAYLHDKWLEFIKGYEDEPEHGKRCLLCFEFNLKDACRVARESGIRFFTTSLTVSRFKKSAQIFEVGEKYDGFQRIDFKKMDGFAESTKMAAQLGLYRQKYCGCEFSAKGSGQ